MRYVRLLTLVVLLLMGAVILAAQDNSIILTIAVEEWRRDQFRRGLFDTFEAQHPGVKVVVVSPTDNIFYGQAAYNFEEHMQGVAKSAAFADVTTVSRYNLSVEATRAGYFLDMSPLVSGDSSLNPDDFFPAAWKSFQWDRGIWALPASLTPQILIYNADAFDEAGLAYPNENWTLDDFANAARALAVQDAQGEVTIPGFYTWDTMTLFRSLLGHGYYDGTTFPEMPLLTQPDLESLLDQWVALEKEGFTTMPEGARMDFNQIPMTLQAPYQLYSNMPGSEQVNWRGALLPGRLAGLDVQGFAISAGTQHPELAYELVKYMTNDATIAQRFYGASPARRTLVGAETRSEFSFQPEISPEVQAVINQAIENGIPMAELRFGDYVDIALGKMREGDVPAQVALQEAEEAALSNLRAAADLRGTTVVVVATPVPTPVLAANDVALQFQLNLSISPIPNRADWDRLIAEFTATDPQVRHIEIVTGFGGPEDAQPDCLYQDYNSIAWMDMEQPQYLNIDPFTDADPGFDRSDFLGDALAQVERDNKLWALPIVIQPEVLWYDEKAFTEANITPPVNGWTVDEFNDALRMLKSASENGVPPFIPESGGGTYLLMLMAAYGAVPYDMSSDPPTVNITGEKTVEAIRQVLNLARDGYIDYQELANFGGGFGGDQPAVTSDTLNAVSWRLRLRTMPGSSDERPYRLAMYPRGSQFTPVSYSLGLAYISKDTLNPEACYRWIRTIAQHPALLMGMPVRRSMLNDPDIAASQGSDVIAVYQMLEAALQDPKAIVVPGQNFGSGYAGAWAEQRWINKVFDNYVLRNGDLESDLAQTVENIETYRACLANTGEFDPAIYDTEEKIRAFWEEQIRCAIKIEPELAQLYGIGS